MKIIFFDIDGTLYKAEEKEVRKEVREELKRVKDKGIKVIVSTGRSFIYIPECIKNLNVDGYICSNGSFIKVKDKILQERLLNVQDVRKVIQYLDMNHYQYDLQMRDRVCSKPTNALLKTYQEYSEVYDDRIENEYQLEAVQDKIHKINIWVNDDHIEELLKETSCFDKEIHLKTSHIELFVPGCTKGTGVRTILDQTGIGKEDAAAFGDSMNDVAMFDEVGLSIAMGNADPRLKEKASIITDTVENNGVAKFLKNL